MTSGSKFSFARGALVTALLAVGAMSVQTKASLDRSTRTVLTGPLAGVPAIASANTTGLVVGGGTSRYAAPEKTSLKTALSSEERFNESRGGLLAAHSQPRYGSILLSLQITISVAALVSGPFAFAMLRRTNRRLRRAEESYRLVSENTADLIWAFDPENDRYTFVSRSVEQLLGYSQEEFMRLRLSDVLTEASVTEVCRAFPERSAAVQQGDRSARARVEMLELRAKDGTVLNCEVSTTFLCGADGRVRQIVGVSRDSTNRIRAERQLRESDRRFRDLLDGLNLAAIVLDASGTITFCNDYVLQITGWNREEMLGRNWIEMCLPEAIREEVTRVFEAGMASGDLPAHYENPIVTRDGKRRDLLWDNTVLRDADGKVIGTASVGHDVTEHKEIEEQLRQAQKMEAVGRLAGGVAHDFNNLLTVINGYADLALYRLSEQDPLCRMVQEIRSAGSRAVQLTKQLLAVSRKQVVEARPIDLNEFLVETEGMLQRLLGEDIEIVMELETGLDPVLADPSQVHQVVLNLAVNARDAMPDGGRLTIGTSTVTSAEIESLTHTKVKAGAHALMTISDTGTGIPTHIQSRIFEPFFTTKEVGQGTGLGLSTVYGIVRQSGGCIWVESREGEGATFKVALPQVRGLMPERAGRQMSDSELAGGGLVLVVEDQDDVRRLAATVLNRYGYEVLEARNGAEAIAAVKSCPNTIDVLLTDIVMPKMTGLELADVVRGLRPGIQVLFMSGYSDDAIADRGFLRPGVNYLPKPWTPETLARNVKAVIGMPRHAKRILVADDDAGVRNLFHDVLRRAEFDVRVAENGREAIRIIRREPCDLLITDLVMPEGEGLETIRAIRKEWPGVKVLAISGAFGGQFLEAAKLLGADKALMKPVSPEALIGAVCELLGKAETPSE